MKKWEKAPDWLKDQFAELMDDLEQRTSHPDIERRQMFGYPCAFINRNMFAGLFGEGMVIRLSDEDRQDFIDNHDGNIFEPQEGRQMKQYIRVPDDHLDDKEFLLGWLERSFRYASALPPKPPKKKK